VRRRSDAMLRDDPLATLSSSTTDALAVAVLW